MKIDIAIVYWEDSAIFKHHVYAQKDDPDLSAAIAISVGHLIREDERVIALAMDWWEDPGHYRILEVIPMSAVRSVVKRRIEVPRPELI